MVPTLFLGWVVGHREMKAQAGFLWFPYMAVFIEFANFHQMHGQFWDHLPF